MNKISLLIAFLFSLTAYGQETATGSLKGKILDKATKQPVMGATVLITGTDNGTATDSTGIFKFTGVKEGTYFMLINYIGYQQRVVNDVRVTAGKTNYLEIEIEELQQSLGEVQVMAFKFENSPMVPVSSFSFSRDEIDRNPGAQGDIFRAIGMLPGVSSSGGQYSAIAVRGQGVRDNIYMVDDIPVTEVTHLEGNGAFSDPNGGRFSIFAPRVIDHAQFQGGGIAAQYGRRSASYLGLGIKEGSMEDVTIDGQLDLLGITANYDGPAFGIKNTGLFLSARYQDFREVIKLVGLKGIGLPRYADFILKSTTQVNKNNKLSVIAIVSPDEYVEDLNKVREDTTLIDASIIDVHTQKYIFGLNLRTLTGKNSYWTNVAYYTYSSSYGSFSTAYPQTDQSGHVINEENISVDHGVRTWDYSEAKVGYRSYYTTNFADHSRLVFGIDADRLAVSNNRHLSRPDTGYVFEAGDFRPDPTQYYTVVQPMYFNAVFNDASFNGSAYLDYSYPVMKKLTLNAGLRYDYTGFAEQHSLSPRLSGTFQLDETNSINFAAGLYYQDPVYSEIADQPKGKLLKEEKVKQYVVGYKRYFSPSLKLTVEGWYKQFDRMVVRPIATQSEQTNSGTGWASGVDVNVTKRLTKKIHGQAGYSYMQSKRDDHDGLGEYDFTFSQPHQVNFLASYKAPRHWILAAKFRYATGKPTDRYIVHADIFNNPGFYRYSKEITGKNTERLKDFISLDIRADYSFRVKKFGLTAFADIVNILNRNNQNDAFISPFTGNAIYDGLAIFPTFGLKFEY